MYGNIKDHLQTQLNDIQEAGLFKSERIITTPQEAHIKVGEDREVLNMCANNYLGLSDHPEIVKASTAGASACRRCGLSAERKPVTRNWKRNSQAFWGLRTQFCIPHVLMRTAVCLKRF